MASDSKVKATLEIGASLDKGGVMKAFGKLNAEQKKLSHNIAATKLEQKQLNVQMRGLKKSSPQVQKLKAQYKALGETIRRDELAVIDLQRQQLKLKSSVPKGRNWKGAASKIGGAMGGIARGAAIAGTAVVGAAGVAWHGLNRMAEAMDKTAKTSRALGLTSDALQELRYAAEKGGMGTTEFDTAMQRMVRRVGEGSKQAETAFKQLGLRMDWMQKQAPDVQLEAVADRLREIEDPGKRLAILMQLFDSEGAKGMATMLEGGRDALHATRVEARELGLVIGGENLQAAEKFNDQMLLLKTKATAALAPIAASLMPKLVDKFRDLVKWIQNNQDKIGVFTETVIHRGAKVIEVVGKLSNVMWKVGGVLSDVAGGWENLTAIGVAFWLAMKIGALSNPFTAIIMGIGLALGLLVTHFDKVKIAAAYAWNYALQPFFQHFVDDLNLVLDLFNKLSGTDLHLPSIAKMDIPVTQSGGSAAPAVDAGMSGGGPSKVVNNYSIAASLDEAETRRVLDKASRERAEREDASAMYSMPVGV